jgi:uncharacterized protein YdaU (DUF1376 family)
MAKEPYLPLFFGDFLASTAEWEGEERALYLLLLGYQWSLGSIPSEPRRVCKLVGWDSVCFDRYWTVVSTKFVAKDGRLMNQRLEQHRARSKEVSEKRAKAGAKGGSVTQANAKQLLEDDEANAASLLGHPSHPIPEEESKKLIGPTDTSSGGVGGTASRKRSAEPRGSRIPDPFLVTPKMRTWATTETPHANVESVTREFVDYWRAIPGLRGRKLDWEGTWRNRMRDQEGKLASRVNGKARETIDDTLARLRTEAAKEGEAL